MSVLSTYLFGSQHCVMGYPCDISSDSRTKHLVQDPHMATPYMWTPFPPCPDFTTSQLFPTYELCRHFSHLTPTWGKLLHRHTSDSAQTSGPQSEPYLPVRMLCAHSSGSRTPGEAPCLHRCPQSYSGSIAHCSYTCWGPHQPGLQHPTLGHHG